MTQNELFSEEEFHRKNTEHPMNENHGAINVDKTRDIPIDYYGYIGVPITYLDKHNPERFFIHNEKRRKQ